MIERSSQSTVKPKKITTLGNKVLVAENIVEKVNVDEVSSKETTIYKYDEKVYTKNEYIELMNSENEELLGVVSDLTQLLIDKGVIY